MFFDRAGAKRDARRYMKTCQPSPVMVTLVFLLLTSGVSMVVHYFMLDPFAQAVQYIMNGYDPVEVYAYVFGGSAAIATVFISILLNLYSTVMTFGYHSYTLRVARGEDGGMSDLFDGFSLVVKVIVLDILMSIFTFLWSMLFIIPGIVAIYAYSQAVYCLLDDPDISPMEAIRRSKMMMKGQKFNLFVVQLSFFGWIILAIIVAGGIGFLSNGLLPGAGVTVEKMIAMIFDLWLMPYQWIVFSRFYSDLIQSQQRYNGPEIEF